VLKVCHPFTQGCKEYRKYLTMKCRTGKKRMGMYHTIVVGGLLPLISSGKVGKLSAVVGLDV
jgi:hypothetical protein